MSIASQSTFSGEVRQVWDDFADDSEPGSLNRPTLDTLEQLGGANERQIGQGSTSGRHQRDRRWSPPTSVRSGEPASKKLLRYERISGS